MVALIRQTSLVVAAMALTVGAMALQAQTAPAGGWSNDPESLRAEAFEAAQSATASSASTALNKVAAGFATSDDQIGKLERKRENLIRTLRAKEERYLQLLGSERADQIVERQQLSTEIDQLREQIRGIDVQIGEINPRYYDLTRPQPLSVRKTQALLNPDEAVLLLMVGEDATYSFAVTREAIEWSRAPRLGEGELAKQVTELRQGLQSRPGDESGDQREPAFNRRLAFDLYTQLIKPVEHVFRGKRVLMTVTSGPLGALPLQVLVTDKPGGSDANTAALKETKFLADRYAVTLLPAVSSLQALRCLLVSPERRHSGCGAMLGNAGRRMERGKVDIVGFGAPTLLGNPAIFKGPPIFGSVFNGPLADSETLRKLPYLPGSRRELDWLKEEYGNRALVKVGNDATETALKANPELRQARYILLSTHGLLASQDSRRGEPGLVFTPPADGTETAIDDGLLTASEAAQLGLSADLVVLSACNTAGSDGTPGGEGLSGLARAFFYAGARALLVSNWEVSDAATVEIVRGTFSALDGPGAHDRAFALQLAMRKVRSDPRWVSPRYWGAFVLVGVPE